MFDTFCVKSSSCLMEVYIWSSWCWNRVWCGITDFVSS